VRFWDASALVPLIIEEAESAAMRKLHRDDSSQVAWWGSRVECASAIRRLERDGVLDGPGARAALSLLGDLSASWSEISPTPAVRAGAERALAVHPLRAADALQLAAALSWRQSWALGGHGMVCMDERLRDAALREGLDILP